MRLEMFDAKTAEMMAEESLYRARVLDEADSLTSHANMFAYRGKYQDAEPLYWRALELKRQVLGTVDREVVACLGNLAELYDMWQHYDQASQLYECMLEVSQRISGNGHPGLRRLARKSKQAEAEARGSCQAPTVDVLIDQMSLT